MGDRLFISGGRGGLAGAVADVFSKAGWEVLAPGRDELDVSSKGAVEAWFREREPFDLAICNAGVTGDALLAMQDGSTWDKVFDVNLGGAVWCAKCSAAGMKRKGEGHVILVGSYIADHPRSGQVLYASSKSALKGAVKSMAAEWGCFGIRVNLVYPGFMETAMTEALSPEVQQRALNRHVLGRLNTPVQTAEFMLFLHEVMTGTSSQLFSLDSRLL